MYLYGFEKENLKYLSANDAYIGFHDILHVKI